MASDEKASSVRMSKRAVSRPCVLHSDHANWSEEDAEQWWQNSCAIIPDLLAKCGRSAADIAGAVAEVIATLER